MSTLYMGAQLPLCRYTVPVTIYLETTCSHCQLHQRKVSVVCVTFKSSFKFPRENMWKTCSLCMCVYLSNKSPSFCLPHQVRHASGRKGFLGEFIDNLRQELGKNQEMKENIKKFREEAKKLEESDALQQARRKYVRTLFVLQSLWKKNVSLSHKIKIEFTRIKQDLLYITLYPLYQKSIEAETVKTSEVFKKTFGSLSDTVREVRYQHFFFMSEHIVFFQL